MTGIPEEFGELYDAALRLVPKSETPEMTQAVVARASSAKLYCRTISYAVDQSEWEQAEAAFVSLLAGENDTEITHMVCLWDSGAVDVPSEHLRSLLTDANPLNGETLVLVRTANGCGARPIRTMVPPRGR